MFVIALLDSLSTTSSFSTGDVVRIIDGGRLPGDDVAKCDINFHGDGIPDDDDDDEEELLDEEDDFLSGLSIMCSCKSMTDSLCTLQGFRCVICR